MFSRKLDSSAGMRPLTPRTSALALPLALVIFSLASCSDQPSRRAAPTTPPPSVTLTASATPTSLAIDPSVLACTEEDERQCRRGEVTPKTITLSGGAATFFDLAWTRWDRDQALGAGDFQTRGSSATKYDVKLSAAQDTGDGKTFLYTLLQVARPGSGVWESLGGEPITFTPRLGQAAPPLESAPSAPSKPQATPVRTSTSGAAFNCKGILAIVAKWSKADRRYFDNAGGGMGVGRPFVPGEGFMVVEVTAEEGDTIYSRYRLGEGFTFVDGGPELDTKKYPYNIRANVGAPVTCRRF